MRLFILFSFIGFFLFLGLDDFPSGEPVHVVVPIGATFLRQRAVHLRVDSTHPRGASFGVVPPPPSSTGADAAEAFGAGAADADVPPSTISDDSDIRRTLDHVLTVQAAHGQILVDVRSVLCMQSWHSFDNLHHHLLLIWILIALWHSVTKRGSTYLSTCRVLISGGEHFCWLELVEFRLYLGASHCSLLF